jgi:tRNA(Arg) A34 adenosine deaminase TadA
MDNAPALSDADEYWMQLALNQAQRAADVGEVPVVTVS